jgi:hypothetical protein
MWCGLQQPQAWLVAVAQRVPHLVAVRRLLQMLQ